MRQRANFMFIALTQRLLNHANYNEQRETLALDWGSFFQKELLPLGFLPLPLSFQIPFEDYYQNNHHQIKAVILTGGNDLSIFNSSKENVLRDDYETHLIQHCIQFNIPILAICRGAQLLAHYFESEINKIENHVGNHFVKDNENNIFKVNSFHHYGITKLGKSLKPLAFSYFNQNNNNLKTIEAFCHLNLPFYAMMWHIERENGLNNKNIFNSFLNVLNNQGATK